MGKTSIEWADAVWNPITGCSSVSEGCEHCYARRFAIRLHGRYGYPPSRAIAPAPAGEGPSAEPSRRAGAPAGEGPKDDPFQVTFHPERLDEPFRWKKPKRIFVCSMGDLFHDDVKLEWIDAILEVIAAAKQHTFFVLTKRPENIEKKLYDVTVQNGCRELGGGDYLPNLWLGTSVEDQASADARIPALLTMPGFRKFVSVEPMLGPVNLLSAGAITSGPPHNDAGRRIAAQYLCIVRQLQRQIDWCICGGETGPGARPMHPEWARSLRDQCVQAGVPFFFKSWGKWMPAEYLADGRFDKRMLDGRLWEERP